MKKNFDVSLIDIVSGDTIPNFTADGHIIPNSQLTIRDAILRALIESNGPQDNPNGDEKLKRFELALQFKSPGEKEVSIEDLSLIKKVCDLRYTTGVYGQIVKVLEQ